MIGSRSTFENHSELMIPDLPLAAKKIIRRVDGKARPRAPLHANFTPGPFDVICARGKQAWNHSGNKLFRSIIDQTAVKYARSTSKLQRSIIVSDVVDAIRSRGNGFVTLCKKTGQWTESGDHLAREKVGQMTRDALSNKYSSSTQAKKLRHKKDDAKISQNLQAVVHSNEDVSYTMLKLSESVKEVTFSDEHIYELFKQANSHILSSIKKSTSLLHRFQEASNMQYR
jgi:hypothetical protein